MEPFRIEPQLPVGAVQTYSAVAPLATHWRDATCEEVDCESHQYGWVTRVPAGSELADEVRSLRGRYHFVETREEGTAVFTFPPGQSCFRSSTHKVPLERDPLYLVRMGDWRGYQGTRVHKRPGDWVEDFATHQQRLAERIERG